MNSKQSPIFWVSLYFDRAENYAHTILGIVAIAAAYVLTASTQRTLVGIVGIVAVWAYLAMRGDKRMAMSGG